MAGEVAQKAAAKAREAAGQTLEEVRSLVIRRDENDRNRTISPLRQAEDAILLDTSDMDIEQVVDRILEICRRKVNG